MNKRPLDKRFSEAVRAGVKVTTIRERAWPVGVPIMLYNWSGSPYRSKHVDVCAVVVLGWWPIEIIHADGGEMVYLFGMENENPLHVTEGFESKVEMDDWFRPLVKLGQTSCKALMRFRLMDGGNN